MVWDVDILSPEWLKATMMAIPHTQTPTQTGARMSTHIRAHIHTNTHMHEHELRRVYIDTSTRMHAYTQEYTMHVYTQVHVCA